MTYIQAIILAIVQGLTEFLPVSSSGHLAILQNLFGVSESPVAFDVLVHLGTLVAIIIYFRSSWKWIFGDILQALKIENKAWSFPGWRLFCYVVVGTIPAVIVGLLWKDKIESAFGFNFFIALSWILTGGFLLLTKVIPPKDKKLSFGRVVIIGLAQALALLPGISRSGSTIMAGWFSGVERKTALHFSFYLAIPAILGATILQIGSLAGYSLTQWIQGGVGFIIAGVVGYFALKILDKVLMAGKIHWFGIYCIIIGIATLLFL
jgi:undecaprenyl-diphosphatase